MKNISFHSEGEAKPFLHEVFIWSYFIEESLILLALSGYKDYKG